MKSAELDNVNARKSAVEKLRQSAESNITLIEEAVNTRSDSVTNMIGTYRGCWIGHSFDDEVRENAASGGIVTELLLHALKKNFVSKVVVTRRKGSSSLYRPSFSGIENEVVMTDEVDTIKSAQSSIYTPVNMPQDINGSDCAVVALPCQIRALRSQPEPPLIIGLFCGHRIEKKGMRLFLEHLGIRISSIMMMDYRVKTGRGSCLMVSATNNFVLVPLTKYYGRFFNFCFIPPACRNCRDQTAEEADISCGDAWLPGYTGESIFVVRTERGEKLVQSALRDGEIIVERTMPRKVIRSQQRSLYIKKGKNSPGILIYKALRRIGCYLSDRPRYHYIFRIWLRLLGIKR